MDLEIKNNTVIVFDLDDTLYNELDFLKSAYIEIAKSLNAENWKPLYQYMFSLYRSRENVFNKIASDFGRDSAELIEMYRNHNPRIELFNGALDIINEIKQKGGKIGIITDGRTTTQTAKIKALGLFDTIDKIIISEAIGTEKPNIANYKAIEVALPNSNYCYIADNFKKDFITPKTLGWTTIGLLDNGKNIHFESHKYYNKKEYLPDHFIFSIRDIQIR